MVHQRAYKITQPAGIILVILAWDDSKYPSVLNLLAELYGNNSYSDEVSDKDLYEWSAEQGHPIIMATGL